MSMMKGQSYMNITKNVTNIIGQTLEREGFIYHKDYGVWEFKRKKNDITQNIVVLRHRYFAGQIKVLFYTATSGMQEFRNFVPEVNKTQEFWEYKTEKELREVLEQFREWIEKYGLEFLDSISVLTEEAREKMEANRYLYEHHREIYERYYDKWEMKNKEPLENIQFLNSKIEEIYDKDFEERFDLEQIDYNFDFENHSYLLVYGRPINKLYSDTRTMYSDPLYGKVPNAKVEWDMDTPYESEIMYIYETDKIPLVEVEWN